MGKTQRTTYIVLNTGKNDSGRIIGKQLTVLKGHNKCEFCNKTIDTGDWAYYCEQNKKLRCENRTCKYHECRGIPSNHTDWYADVKVVEYLERREEENYESEVFGEDDEEEREEQY